jgi:hypothetical protein
MYGYWNPIAGVKAPDCSRIDAVVEGKGEGLRGSLPRNKGRATHLKSRNMNVLVHTDTYLVLVNGDSITQLCGAYQSIQIDDFAA